MRASDVAVVTLDRGVEAALARVPASAGVGQIVAEGERNLVIGRPANLRKWAAGHLGRARPPKPAPGKLPPRPPTDLTPIAAAIRWVETTSPFAQRLAYERLMSRYVPLAKRRDLKAPAWLRLVPGTPLPDLVIQPAAEGEDVFGPFRDRRAAIRARDALHKHFRIRPCDFDFKPPTGVPDGLPADLARALEGTAGVESIPAWVGRAGARSLVVERGRDGIEVYPVAAGSVLDAAAVTAPPEALEDAVGGLAWAATGPAPDDTPWLNAWRHGRRSGVEIPIAPGEPAAETAGRIRAAVGAGEVPVVG